MKVLYACEIYPSANSPYIESEVRGVAAAGVDVHVWSQNASCPFPHPVAVPLHANRPLGACIEAIRPDLVHAYYLSLGEQVLEEVRAAGVPLTIRAHGFEYTVELMNRLAADRAVSRLVVYPHLVADAEPAYRRKVAALTPMFNPAFYYREPGKDRRLVLRAASALPTKNLEYFMRAATLCPEHRFVLVLGGGFDYNAGIVEQFRAFNASLGDPVEIRINLQWPEMSALVRRAGIYMATPPIHRPGMPISVAEAMAAGCFVVAPEMEGMRDYVGASGARLYRGFEEAASIVRETLAWSDEDWERAGARASAFAYGRYASDRVAPELVAIWRNAIERPQGAAPFDWKRAWRRIAGRRAAAPART